MLPSCGHIIMYNNEESPTFHLLTAAAERSPLVRPSSAPALLQPCYETSRINQGVVFTTHTTESIAVLLSKDGVVSM